MACLHLGRGNTSERRTATPPATPGMDARWNRWCPRRPQCSQPRDQELIEELTSCAARHDVQLLGGSSETTTRPRLTASALTRKAIYVCRHIRARSASGLLMASRGGIFGSIENDLSGLRPRHCGAAPPGGRGSGKASTSLVYVSTTWLKGVPSGSVPGN